MFSGFLRRAQKCNVSIYKNQEAQIFVVKMYTNRGVPFYWRIINRVHGCQDKKEFKAENKMKIEKEAFKLLWIDNAEKKGN